MATTDVTKSAEYATGRPIQMLTYTEKNKQWYKDNALYYRQRSFFRGNGNVQGQKDISQLYAIYNNKFPKEWFAHITNPLSSKKPEHRAFPAKIRPVTILRTNIDLLQGEYLRRPFIYNVENLGEDGYIEYTEGLSRAIRKNLDQHFMIETLKEIQASGQELTPEQMKQLQQNPPTPEQVKMQYAASYKDARAIKGNKWLRRKVRECEMERKFQAMFKDWLIAGSAFSYKGVHNENLVYERVPVSELEFDKSESEDFIEDGEYAVRRKFSTISDVVDRYYMSLKQKDLEDLERKYHSFTPTAFYDTLSGLYTDPNSRNRIPIYHVTWKGRKKIGFLTYFDEESMGFVTEEVDENYLVDKEAGEVVEWKWVNEAYEVTLLGNDDNCIVVEYQPIPVQRNEMNNASACKLPYNGCRFSDTHAENISVLEMGIPFQIMYAIVGYTLEKTIAKSKGKIILLDKNAIPRDGDWDDEKFFYYSDALGYGLLNRNQTGVDKTWNQYTVLDMTLFDSIKQLIELQQAIKQEWDDVIGVTRQRKGQTYASDLQGVNERAVFQSTVITDIIFTRFEQFRERELQAVMDYAKFLTGKGMKAVYNDDIFGTYLMDITPEDFASAEFGVYVDSSSIAMDKKNKTESYIQAMLQNNVKPSTMLEVIDSVNIAELKTKLKQIEALEEQIAAQTAQNEQEHQKELLEIQKDMQAYQAMLDRQNDDAAADRKEELQHIIGQYAVEVAQVNNDGKIEAAQISSTTPNGEGGTDPAQISMDMVKLQNDTRKTSSDIEDKRAQRQQRDKELQLKIADQKEKVRMNAHQREMDKKDQQNAVAKLAIDRKKANKPTATKK